MTNSSAIEIKGLKKYFPTKYGFGPKIKAIDGISFDVKKGETFGFLGPNGAGKTTTIRCLMNFSSATEGKITVLGLDSVRDNVSVKNIIGYLPGNVRLYDKWTGEDHIKFVEAIRGKSVNIKDLITRLDFDPKIKFHDLSSGNKQKLGLILALMNEPEVLVMDEPTIGLDPLLQNVIYEILSEMRQKGVTIFISSHNLSEVEKICDRVGIIKEGKMVEVQTIKELEGKKIHRVEVRFAGGQKYTATDFRFDGVKDVEKIADGLILTVGGDLNAVVKKLAHYNLADIEITHASLEEKFLKFYKRK